MPRKGLNDVIDLLLSNSENVFHFFKAKLQMKVSLTGVYIKVKDNLKGLKKKVTPMLAISNQ